MKTNKKVFAAYESPIIDEMVLLNEGVFCQSGDGSGNIDPDIEEQ